MEYEKCLDLVGNTPIVKVDINNLPNINVYAKLEYLNPTGSVKDRAAEYIIQTLKRNGEINDETTIIESSSGNFGIALSAYCKKNNLKFYCVVDLNILDINEMLIKQLSTKMIKVTEMDKNGGYLLGRIEMVKKIQKEIKNSYWINQYANPYSSQAYYYTLGQEICSDFDRIDYVFIGVSSGGTITGVSRKIKEKFPNVKIVAVDIDGSVVFGGKAKKRYIPGIGSSMVPEILKEAKIDEVISVNENDTAKMCHELLTKNLIFAGGSSGSVCVAIKNYFSEKKLDYEPNVITIFPDRGDRYINTIYNKEWCSKLT